MPEGQDTAQGASAHDLCDPLATSEPGEVAGHPRGVGALVAGGTDLHPLGTRRGVGAAARSRAGARRRAGHGLPRRQQRAGSPESGRCRKKGDLRPSKMLLKHLAALVGAMAPRRAWAGTRTPPRYSAPRPVAQRAQVGGG